MTTLTETLHAGAFIASEANGNRSRDAGVMLSGTAALIAGSVLGKTLVAGAAVANANAGNSGNGAMGAITVTGPARVGRYRLNIIEPAADAGTFELLDPDGQLVGTGNVASAFAKGGLAFTLADGSNNFVAGDGFTIDVTGSYKYMQYDPAGTDGEDVPAGILYADCDASAADKPCVVFARDGEVNINDLVWYSGADAAGKTVGLNGLAKLGIIGRA